VAAASRARTCGHRLGGGSVLVTASKWMWPRRTAWASSIPSRRRWPVATDCRPRMGRSRSLTGTWERSNRLGRLAAGPVQTGADVGRAPGAPAHGPPVARVFVRDHHLRPDAPPGDRLLEEGPSTRQVALRAQQDVHDLAGPVDGAVQIGPPAADPDVGLIRPPATADRSGVPPPFRREERPELVRPREDRPGGDVNLPLGQQVADVGGREAGAEVPADRRRAPGARRARARRSPAARPRGGAGPPGTP
jgi:hypothetical protein